VNRADCKMLTPKITDGIVTRYTRHMYTSNLIHKEIETAKTRLKRVLEVEREEKRNATKAVH
jgi:hypothetical protein